MFQLGVDEDEDEGEGEGEGVMTTKNIGEGDKHVSLQSIDYSRRETEIETNGDVASTATDFLLDTLKDILTSPAYQIEDTRGDIENLARDLRILKAFLRDIAKRDEFTKEIVKEIHDVVYEVEDTIEVFVTKAIQRRNKSFFARFGSTSASDTVSIGKKVQAIKGRVEQCRYEMGILSLDQIQPAKPEARPPRKKDVVGFEDVTEHLIRRLLKETDYFDVISIIGMLGLGKTTVAWKILHDPRVVYKFPVRIWLPISQQFFDREIFLDILRQVDTINDDTLAKHDHELADLVAAHLEGGSFLIVMDDVWKPADWDRLRVAIPTHNMKGKVLVTSRSEEVGRCASNPSRLYNLRFFTSEESWELFRLEALRQPHCPPELEEVGRKIAEKCGGLPLAIVVIGGILATKFLPENLSATKTDWEKVSPRVSSYLAQNDPEKRMPKLISLSYNDLPYHLRACFLYLWMFPDDYEIPVSKLIRMWIAEGFVQQNNHENLEETAEKYLDDLINRNLVKGEKFKDHDGKVKTCRIHDSLRDFCRSEAADANFLQGITCNNDGQFVPSASDIATNRRLFIHSNCSRFISLKPFGPCVRSFVCFPKEKYALSTEHGANIFSAFPLVRVLDVLAFKFATIDSHLYKLVHMRYIALSSNLSILPSKFDKLSNIQTLIVDTTSRTLQVKADIWKMKRLRHFKTNSSAILPKPSIGVELSSRELQTLCSISVGSCTKALTGLACNLKKLGIRGKLALLFDAMNESFDSLGEMKKLGKLKLINDVYPDPPREGRLDCLPEPHRFPSGITRLTLCATFLSWDHMSTLGLLGNLKVLKLKDNAFMGKILESVDGGFQCLEILHIEDTDLEVWNASSNHYPKLRGLVLKNCEKLLQIPMELADIETLKNLELYTCISAAQSVKAISDAKKKQDNGSEFLLSIYPPNADDHI